MLTNGNSSVSHGQGKCHRMPLAANVFDPYIHNRISMRIYTHINYAAFTYKHIHGCVQTYQNVDQGIEGRFNILLQTLAVLLGRGNAPRRFMDPPMLL